MNPSAAAKEATGMPSPNHADGAEESRARNPAPMAHDAAIDSRVRAAAAAGALVTVGERELPPFSDLFCNDHPVEMEIGCGKAKFLIARALENPGINFLGVDTVWKWLKFGVQRSERRQLPNIRFVRADARDVLRYGVRPLSVDIFHIYFPDPWPKRRQRKRRLVTGDFLRLLHSRLKEGGLIELATDHEDYFHYMRLALIQSAVRWNGTAETANERIFHAASMTNYEIKYRAAERPLYYLELRK